MFVILWGLCLLFLGLCYCVGFVFFIVWGLCLLLSTKFFFLFGSHTVKYFRIGLVQFEVGTS